MKLSFILNIRKQGILLFMLLCLLNGAKAQNPYWALPPYSIDFVTGTVKTLPNTPLSKAVTEISNGIFDSQGNLRFYGVNQLIKDRKNIITDIGNKFLSNTFAIMAILPVPEECNNYYVVMRFKFIYKQNSNYPIMMYCKKINYNPTDGSVTIVWPDTHDNPYGGDEMLFAEEFAPNSTFEVASTKLYTGNNGSSYSYLYVVGQDNVTSKARILKYKVTKDVFESVQQLYISTSPGEFFSPSELELSSDERYLAWGNKDNVGSNPNEAKVFLYDLATPNAVPQKFSISGGVSVAGTEFSKDSRTLFFSKKDIGIGVIDVTTAQILSDVPNTTDLGKGQLERAVDGNIYGSNGNQLKGFSESNYMDGVIKTFDVPGIGPNLIHQIDHVDYNRLYSLGGCIPYQTLTSTIAGPYTANYFVKTQGIATVNTGTTAEITAGTSILFTPGFSVVSGATFRAFTQACGMPIDNCPNTGRLAAFNTNVSTENESTSSLPVISPNPSQGSIAIDLFSSSKETIQTEIIDMTGIKVMNLAQVNSLSEGANHFNIDLSILPTGVYILKMNGENVHHSTRLVIVQ